MSLLNKMLHDLEQRRADGSAPAVHREIRPLPAMEGSPTWIKGGIFGAGLILVGTIGWGLIGKSAPDTAVAPAASPLPPVVADANLPSLTLPAPMADPLPEVSSSQVIVNARSLSPGGVVVDDGLRMSDRLSLPTVGVPPANSPSIPAKPVEMADPVGGAVRKPVAVSMRDEDRIPAVEASIEKRELQRDVRDQAERLYRAGVSQMTQGREQDALATFRAALRDDPEHLAARQQIIKSHVDRRAYDAARGELEEGLRRQPKQTAWALLLARLLVDQGKAAGAIEILQRHETHAGNSADYFGAMAAVLQKLSRHSEAEAKYLRATQLDGANGRWWIGLGMTREAQAKSPDARDAYRAALATTGLPGELRAFAEERLR